MLDRDKTERMKLTLSLIIVLIAQNGFGQIVNSEFNSRSTNYQSSCGIVGEDYALRIKASSLYRAKPDGYHITYTTTFIEKTTELVEAKMNLKMDSLIQSVSSVGVEKHNVVIDLVSFDPIFSTDINNSVTNSPIGFKVTENISFDVKSFEKLRLLTVKCMELEIYDIVSVKLYVSNMDDIYAQLSSKTLDILEFKKSTSERIGWKASGGRMNFQKCHNVYYPSDSYLKSMLRNASLYMHDISQNAEINIVRNVQVNAFNAIDLKNADFIFHPDELGPVIQFHYQIVYTYSKPIEKEESKDDEEKEKVFFILDKEGELKKFSFDE